MSKATHTPGPWSATQNAYSVWFVNGGEEHDNGRVKYRDLVCGGNNHDTLTEANARLIAAAPDLLEALVGWQKLHDDMIAAGGSQLELPEHLIGDFALVQMRLMDATRAAIAKARGQ